METIDLQVHPFTSDDLAHLLADREGVHVSIFLPTHITGSELRQDPIRLKNLLREADARLEAHGLDGRTRKALLEPALALLPGENALSTFWKHQRKGLALYLTSETFIIRHLPYAVDEKVMVGTRFAVRPLLPLLNTHGEFYVLALDKGGSHLYHATPYSLREIELEDVPTSLEEAFKYDDFESRLNLHTGTGRRESGGQQGAMYHGHGDNADESREAAFLRRFFQHLENGVRAELEKTGERIPLVLVGTSKNQGFYREANHYAHLLDNSVDRNPRDLNAEELLQHTWPLVEPLIERHREEALNNFQILNGRGEARASTNPRTVIPGAYFQRIDALFIPKDQALMGDFDPETSEISLDENGDDLLDLAAAHTLLNGGQVYVMDPEAVPGDETLAAILRF